MKLSLLSIVTIYAFYISHFIFFYQKKVKIYLIFTDANHFASPSGDHGRPYTTPPVEKEKKPFQLSPYAKVFVPRNFRPETEVWIDMFLFKFLEKNECVCN